jgi:hypothetical protein
VLQVDHVVPVVEGGGDEEENLIACCSDCNHGKFTRNVSAESVPRDYVTMAEDAESRTEQLRAYREHLMNLRKEVEESIDFVAEAFFGKGFVWAPTATAEIAKVERFINLLGLGDVADAARIARERLPDDHWGTKSRFKYFCGVCWNTATRRGIRGDNNAR